jgi:hypothetical protein
MKLSRFFKVPIDYILGSDFIRWDINSDMFLYSGVNEEQSTDSDISVSEASVSYGKAATINSTSSLREIHTKFNRIEFDGLTQEEIDLLAEYAAFIKSRRKTK